MKLPETLSRKAIIETFNYLEPVTWENLFDREDTNGVARHRVPGCYQRKAYYRTAGIMEWLVTEGYYTLDDYRRIPRLGGESSSPALPATRRVAFG